MKVLVIKSGTFESYEFSNVTSITYSSNNYVITASGTAHTYAADTYDIYIL